MYKTFILVTQEAEKLGAKHLPFFLRHPVGDYRKTFHKYLCTQAHTSRKHTRARFAMSKHIFALCTNVCARFFNGLAFKVQLSELF